MRRRLLALAVLVCSTPLLASCSYNKFTTQEEAIKAQFSQVENQLQRRNDLIPNLVESVKGFAAQERDVIQSVTDARAKMAGAGTPTEKIAAANETSSALARLLVVVENYPQLKSDARFAQLMDQLEGTENRIAVERQRYNERVQQYNTARKRFPGNMTAKMFGFDEYPYWEVPKEAQAVPRVDFGR